MSVVGRFGRWLAVIITAWALRRGVPVEDMMVSLTKAYRHRDGEWRLGVLHDAQARNRATMSRA